jgi:L,D-transpeptidase YcbB
MRIRHLAASILAAFILLVQPAASSPRDVIVSLADQGAQAIEWRGLTIDLNKLLPIYQNPDAPLIFIEGNKLSALGAEFVVALGKAREDGLEPKDYIHASFGSLNRLESVDDAAGAELALAQAFLRYARDIHTGRPTPSLDVTNIVIDKKTVDPVKWLNYLAENGTAQTVKALRPRHPQYEQLRRMLVSYRSFQSLGGWDPIPAGPSLKPGMYDIRVAALRDSLAGRGYKNLTGGDPNAFDAKLTDAVKRYQRASGIEPDGVVGKGTIGILNVPVEERIRHIIVNMERWRWLPANLGARHVFVNQAGAELFLVDKGKVIDNRRVIVGKPFHQTPMFSDRISYVEFNPTWTVSANIAKAEFLPKLIKDPGYLERNDYKIYASWAEGAPEMDPWTVDWSLVKGGFPYRIVQQPGDKNALGYVKFMFPNKFNIYLHDTPSRQLFASTGRAFSHGCIRVHEAQDFAEKLMGLDRGMTRDEIDAIVAYGELKRISLKQKVPVHLAYFTVWIGDDGVVQFFPDIYSRDRPVAQILFGQS